MNKNRIYFFGLVAALALALAIVWWLLAPVWRPLFAYQLPQESSLEVIQLLDQQGIEYKLQERDGVILVRGGDLSRAHRVLDENGVPKKLGSGLEVFGDSDYGLSEFAQNINYQRGVEEELARTILRMQGIKDVRVHLTIKKDSLFEDRKQEPKASVVLGFKDGVVYGPEKIRGIQEIVSAAVPNLLPQSVTAITNQGIILSASNSGTIADSRSVEEKYRAVLMDLMEGLVGVDEYKLAVNVQMDLTRKTTVQEKVIPESDSGKGFIIRNKSTSRSDESSAGTRSGALQTSIDEEFVYSREKSEIIYPTGGIARISVGLVVFGNSNLELKSSIEALVVAALAMDLQGGDRISIVFADKPRKSAVDDTYKPESLEALSTEAVRRDDQAEKYVFFGLVFLCVVMFFLSLFLYLALRRRQARELSSSEKEMLVADLVNWLDASK